MIIAVDFDGSLVNEKGTGIFPRPLEWRPGAEAGLRRIAHHALILHTARLTPPDAQLLDGEGARSPEAVARFVSRRQQLEAELRGRGLWLRREGGVFDILWDRPGKPDAFLFIDDRSLAGPPDWRAIVAAYG